MPQENRTRKNNAARSNSQHAAYRGKPTYKPKHPPKKNADSGEDTPEKAFRRAQEAKKETYEDALAYVKETYESSSHTQTYLKNLRKKNSSSDRAHDSQASVALEVKEASPPRPNPIPVPAPVPKPIAPDLSCTTFHPHNKGKAPITSNDDGSFSCVVEDPQIRKGRPVQFVSPWKPTTLPSARTTWSETSADLLARREEAKQKKAELEARRDELKAKVKKTPARQLEAVQKEIARVPTLLGDIEKLTGELRETKEARKKAQKELAHLQKLQAKRKELPKEHERLETELEQAKQELENSEKQKASLETKIAKKKETRGSKVSKASDNTPKSNQPNPEEELKAAKANEKQALKKNRILKSTITSDEAELARKIQETEAIKKETAARQTELEAAQTKNAERLAKLEALRAKMAALDPTYVPPPPRSATAHSAEVDTPAPSDDPIEPSVKDEKADGVTEAPPSLPNSSVENADWAGCAFEGSDDELADGNASTFPPLPNAAREQQSNQIESADHSPSPAEGDSEATVSDSPHASSEDALEQEVVDPAEINEEKNLPVFEDPEEYATYLSLLEYSAAEERRIADFNCRSEEPEEAIDAAAIAATTSSSSSASASSSSSSAASSNDMPRRGKSVGGSDDDSMDVDYVFVDSPVRENRAPSAFQPQEDAEDSEEAKRSPARSDNTNSSAPSTPPLVGPGRNSVFAESRSPSPVPAAAAEAIENRSGSDSPASRAPSPTSSEGGL